MTESPVAAGAERTRTGMATLHDVAQAAGVSLATASRVLNGSTRKVAESYRDRVESAASELGYTANLSAQATAKGTSAVVALLVADIADPYFGLLASGVARGADEAGLVVTIAITERDDERELRLVRALRGQRPRALILAASRSSQSSSSAELQQELDALSASGGRVVAIGPGAGAVRSVAIDNRGGARALATALTDIGYRRAAVIAAEEGVLTSDDRVAGFTEGFVSGGGTITRVHRGAFTREAGSSAMEALLAEGLEPGTVVFGISDVVAIGALTALHAAGRDVGADIALAGFDDIPTGRDVTPALTTVRVSLEEVGYETLRAAVDDEWQLNSDALRLEVLVRASTPPR